MWVRVWGQAVKVRVLVVIGVVGMAAGGVDGGDGGGEMEVGDGVGGGDMVSVWIGEFVYLLGGVF